MRRIGRAGVGLQSALCLASVARVECESGRRLIWEVSPDAHKTSRVPYWDGASSERARSNLDTTGVSVTDGNIELQGDRQSRRRVPGQSCHSDGFGPTGGSWVGEGGAGKCGAFRVWRRWDERGRARTSWCCACWRWADRLSCSPKKAVVYPAVARGEGFPSASGQVESK